MSDGWLLFVLDIDTWRVVYHQVDCELSRDVIKQSVMSGHYEIWFPSAEAGKILEVISENDWVHEWH